MVFSHESPGGDESKSLHFAFRALLSGMISCPNELKRPTRAGRFRLCIRDRMDRLFPQSNGRNQAANEKHKLIT